MKTTIKNLIIGMLFLVVALGLTGCASRLVSTEKTAINYDDIDRILKNTYPDIEFTRLSGDKGPIVYKDPEGNVINIRINDAGRDKLWITGDYERLLVNTDYSKNMTELLSASGYEWKYNDEDKIDFEINVGNLGDEENLNKASEMMTHIREYFISSLQELNIPTKHEDIGDYYLSTRVNFFPIISWYVLTDEMDKEFSYENQKMNIPETFGYSTFNEEIDAEDFKKHFESLVLNEVDYQLLYAAIDPNLFKELRKQIIDGDITYEWWDLYTTSVEFLRDVDHKNNTSGIISAENMGEVEGYIVVKCIHKDGVILFHFLERNEKWADNIVPRYSTKDTMDGEVVYDVREK